MDWGQVFSHEFAESLEEGFAAAEELDRPLAVFDADGTLWAKDIGEAFLRWLIAGKLLINVDYSKDIYFEYEAMVDEDRTNAYSHAVKLMAGLTLSDITRWSVQMAYSWPNYRPRMRALVAGLKQAGFEVWIVSASNEWTIRTAAPFAGIEPDQCIGIKTRVRDGLITKEIIKPVTCGPGKVHSIEKNIGFKPVFAFGDSMGDFDMLEYVEFPMVVGELSNPTNTLIDVAEQRGWPVHLF